MSFDHKAFIFDYDRFEIELKTILENAIDTDRCQSLENYIAVNLDWLRDPDEGEQLSEGWKKLFDVRADPFQYGDFALTRFYDPTEDIGLGHNWSELDNLLLAELQDSSCLRGLPLGKDGNYFDPGKMGSYFQSLSLAIYNISIITGIIDSQPAYSQIIQPAIDMYERVIFVKKGLYITF